MTNLIRVIIVVAFILGIGFCIYLMLGGSLSEKETALLSIVLTIFSILATWIVTHMYTQSQHKKAIQTVQEVHRANLRTYALKAAEKVNNLSNQLGLLAAYLQESVDETDSERVQEDLMVKQERIGSAIRMIGTLKSVNDTALSDWEDVIGDELDEQREKQTERQEEVKELIDRLESLSESQLDTQQYAQDSTQVLAKEIESLRKDLRSIAISWGLSPVPLVKSSEKKTRVNVESRCPSCEESITYTQKQKPTSIKTIKCKSCGMKLISRYSAEKRFVLEPHQNVMERIVCPSCKNECEVLLDTLPNSSAVVNCENCHATLTIIRSMQGINIKTDHSLTEDIIELVKNNLPPQPWPKGINKSIADKLGLPNKLVAEATQTLIARGVFNLQFGGRLYIPLSAPKRKSSTIKEDEE